MSTGRPRAAGGHAPLASVVIPAHDEDRVIAACLGRLADLAASGEVQVVVVANGCTDRTAEVAASFSGVRVVQVEVASKVAALNAGDRAVAAWPRVYLDADVVLSAQALLALVEELTTGRAGAASVRVRFATEGRPWAVRSFYRAYERIPYTTDGLLGLGLYGLSEAGRARFGAFPDLVADDLFVQRLFAPHERVVLPDHYFTVQVPHTTSALLAVRTRTAQGNAQLADAAAHNAGAAVTGRSSGSTAQALVRLVMRNPRLVPAVAVYALVTLVARRRAAWVPSGAWQRDATTR